MKRVAIANLGCKANRADAMAIAARLDPGLISVVGPDEPAELYLINSCTVTHSSGAQSLKLARQIARRYPGRPIVFAGCHATLAPGEIAGLREVARVIGNSERARVPEIIAELLGVEPAPATTPAPRALAGDHARPVIKVQDGCDRRCAYCIVPLVRGPSRSVPVAEVVAQVRALASAGYPEVVLTGIHAGDYGRGLPRPQPSLADLVALLLQETAVARLRLTSIEPDELSPRLAGLVTDHPRVCRHLHVPLQSGSDRVLAAMRRPARAGHAAERLDGLLRRCPALSVGLDLLVGFPGEADAEFEATLALVRALDVAYLHVFPFSPRPGTEAAAMPGRLPEREVRQRCEALRALGVDKRRRFYAAQVGTRVAIVAERRDAASGLLRGTSDNYLDVVVDSAAASPALVEVEVTGAGKPARAVEVRT